jgi:hypothetical protein
MVRQLQQRLRKPSEALGREITQQLFLLGCGAQMLRYSSPPVAQAWCQMMLDTRGGLRLSEQVLNDLLLRATGVTVITCLMATRVRLIMPTLSPGQISLRHPAICYA